MKDQPIVHPIAVRVNNNAQQTPSGAKAPENTSKHSRSSSLGSIQPPALPPRDNSNLASNGGMAAQQNDSSNNMASAIIYQNQIENSVEQIHNANMDEMKILR